MRIRIATDKIMTDVIEIPEGIPFQEMLQRYIAPSLSHLIQEQKTLDSQMTNE